MNIVPAETSGLAQAIHVLKNGGIVAHATETCYGLACDLTNPEAVAKLFMIKERPIDQPVSALFSSIEKAKRYVVWNKRAEEIAKEYLPGPLTIILPMKKEVPTPIWVIPNPQQEMRNEKQPKEFLKNVCKRHPEPVEWATFAGTSWIRQAHHDVFQRFPTLAFRLSSHLAAQALAHAFGAPLSTTSANLHGKPETFGVQEIVEQFSDREHQPDLIVDSGTLPKSSPSTIVDLSGEKERVLREGEIKL